MSPESGRLSAFIDGELGPVERKRVEEHVAGCSRCAEKLADIKAQAGVLSKAIGGLLLHVDLAKRVEACLPEQRKSLVMTTTHGIRRRFALAGCGVAVAFALFSLVARGPTYVLSSMGTPAQTALFLNWAIMIIAISLMVWPEKVASLEARFWAFMRGGSPRVSAKERMVVQGVGLVFLCLSTAFNIMLITGKGLPF
jgi:anti-sigma factor RsiW